VKRLVSLLAMALALAPQARAWGFSAHRLVNRLAIGTLPQPLRELFARNADYVAEHSIDPDLWRGAGAKGEEIQHYLDIDAFGDPDRLPRVEAEHVRRNGADALARGRAPWRIAEAYRQLVDAFRSGDPAQVLARAAELGHYVGDVHVPLHSVLNYDGRLTGQKGIHERWESELFGRYEAQLSAGLVPGQAAPRRDPVDLAFEALLESLAEAPAVLDSDRALVGPADFADTLADDRYGDAYYSRMFAREEGRMRARLQRSAERIGALWLGAWQEAGQPSLPEFRFPYVRGASRLVLLSLDGAAARFVDAAVRRGAMPNLQRLQARGAAARGAISARPVKTPAGHAAVYTGAWADRNGIAGIEMPVPGRSVLTARSGYTSEMLRAEPIWVAAARQGLHASTLNTTQTVPFAPFLQERRFGGDYGARLSMIDGYQSRRAAAATHTAGSVALRPAAGWGGAFPHRNGLEFDLSVAGARVEALLFDDPEDPVAGFDTLNLAPQKGDGVRLKPDPPGANTDAFRHLVLRTPEGAIGLHFRLFSLRPDGSDFLLFVSETAVIRSNRPLLEAAALEASGGFVGNGAGRLYEDGAFGPTLWQGGTGLAEARYLETARLAERQFRRLLAFGIERTRWDLLLAYLPFPDEQLHLWLGHVDASLPGHDAALAARLSPILDEALKLADSHVGYLMDAVGNDVVLALVSDHGMGPANRVVAWNVALRRAGLLSLTPTGEVDLARTRAIYFPGNSGYFLVNRVGRERGIVTAEQEGAVLEQLEAVVRGVLDPDTRKPVARALVRPRDGAEPGIGGPNGGDLYVDLAPGYYSSAAFLGDLVSAQTPSGEHLSSPELPEMHASFVVAGPGVASGADLGLIRQIDIAPTLAALLGIGPPAHATGRALPGALERGLTGVAGR
jgi:predicted AlkP superfamily phosphohydrolase/phosphomutase